MWRTLPWIALLSGVRADTTAAASASASTADVRQIAVIGAGAAGASTAFHLQRFAAEANSSTVNVNVTLYEKNERVGGRTLTVDVFGDTRQPVELGASIFVEANRIIWSAIDEFGLPRIPAGSSEGDDGDDEEEADDKEDSVLGVWDGDKFVFTEDEAQSDWWNLARLLWTYGRAPYRTNKLVQGTIKQFLQLYEAPYFPFRSLTTRARELELTSATGTTGAEFLAAHGVSAAFAHDLVQASTRVNYASNLAGIHGLDTMVSLAPQGASQVRGGNWQVFDRMVQAAVVAAAGSVQWRPNTTVTAVTAVARVGGGGRYVVTTSDNQTSEYDNIVLAGPQQFSGIQLGKGVLQTTITPVAYVQLHVTLFTTAQKLSAAYFGLAPGSKVPTMVLTTLAEDDDQDEEKDRNGAGKAGFFSVSTLRRVVNPATKQGEYVYKIFSPTKVTAAFLSALLGVDVPDSITSGPSPISWYHPHVFYSYPKAVPRTTFLDPVVGDGVYYTSGMEGFISTMETSALMGKNVARLIVDDMQGLSTGHAVGETAAVEEL